MQLGRMTGALVLALVMVLGWAAPASAACMERPLSSAPQVPESERGTPYRIVAADDAVPALEAKGYQPIECSAAFADQAAEEAYRDEICALSASGNGAVQNQIERAIGERPAALCAAAEAELGAWIRPPADAGPAAGPQGPSPSGEEQPPS